MNIVKLFLNEPLVKFNGMLDFPFREKHNLIAAPKIPTFISIFKLSDRWRYPRLLVDDLVCKSSIFGASIFPGSRQSTRNQSPSLFKSYRKIWDFLT